MTAILKEESNALVYSFSTLNGDRFIRKKVKVSQMRIEFVDVVYEVCSKLGCFFSGLHVP
jgi:hypothetical protein